MHLFTSRLLKFVIRSRYKIYLKFFILDKRANKRARRKISKANIKTGWKKGNYNRTIRIKNNTKLNKNLNVLKFRHLNIKISIEY